MDDTTVYDSIEFWCIGSAVRVIRIKSKVRTYIASRDDSPRAGPTNKSSVP